MKIIINLFLEDFLVKTYLAVATRKVTKAPQLNGIYRDACDKVQKGLVLPTTSSSKRKSRIIIKTKQTFVKIASIKIMVKTCTFTLNFFKICFKVKRLVASPTDSKARKNIMKLESIVVFSDDVMSNC
jgi:hypothetical protein